MILIDADIIILDRRYQNDPRYATNRRLLDHFATSNVLRGVTSQVFLELIGNLSFNVRATHVRQLPQELIVQYGLVVVPPPTTIRDYAGCTVDEIIDQMTTHMALGDAVQAVQIARYASTAQCLLTWNARHFAGKVAIPVFTPEEWLNQNAPATP